MNSVYSGLIFRIGLLLSLSSSFTFISFNYTHFQSFIHSLMHDFDKFDI